MKATDLTYLCDYGRYASDATREELTQKLGEYEATGLTPEDVNILWDNMAGQSAWDEIDARLLEEYKATGLSPKDINDLINGVSCSGWMPKR